MKKVFTLLVFLAITGIAYCTDVSGNITVNTTWDLAGSPYIVTGNVTVDAGIILTIDAGVEVKFNNGRSLFVYGTVNATSTTFTSNDGSPTPGIWNYLRFYSGSTSTFSNCAVEYADYIEVQSGASLTMNNSNTIENMYYYGIYNAGTVNLTNSIIDLAGYITYGYGIYTYGASSITNLNNVNILNCNYGVFIYSDDSQVNFTDCSVSANIWPVYIRYAGDITTAGTNDFTGNTRNAFYVYPASISKNWTLPYVNVPYYFRTNFTVNNTYTLTIANNNIIKFAMNTGMEIRGKLTANASAGNNIFFTSERDDNWGGDTNGDGASTAAAVSDWKGVGFYDESDDASVMRRCQLRYAGYYHIGGITLYDASPTIDLCELQFNYYGAYFQYASNPTFTNNTVGSSSLTPIAMSFEANPTFTNNVLSFMDNQYDAIGLIGGTLTANAHVVQRDFTTVSNITYYMLSEIIVPSGLTLTIDPGIVIKSSSYTRRFRIQGKLIADGTAADWITFTSVKDDNHGNPGDTNKDGTITTPSTGDMSAIIFEDGYDPTSIVDYVRIKYASVYSYSYSNGGSNHYVHGCAIVTLSQIAPAPAGPTISNCEIRESAYGVSSYQASNPIVTNNSFINITNTPLSLSGSANPTYSGNTFTNCGINALGLIGHNVVVNGAISKRNVAGYTNITYVLLENITVMNGTYLDIDPGVVIKMLSKYWYIDGGFKMNGTVAEHVVFTSLYDDNVGNPMDTNGDGNATTPSSGNWYRIEFDETSDDAYCELNYADLQYGGNSYGAIRTINASPTVNNTLIDQSSGFGIRCEGISAPIFDAVDIQNCSSDPFAMSLTSNPTFSNITFTANYSNGIYILEGTLSSNATLIKRNVAGFTNIAYIIDALTISSGAVLTLEQGIIIKFRGSYFDGIYVHGGLSAIATAGQKIIFTSFKDDSAGGDTNNDGSSTVPGGSDWDGILYYPEGEDVVNKLIYCELRYGGGGYGSPFGSGSGHGVVRIKDAYVQINESIFQQGTNTAIGVYGSANPDITNCQIYNFNNFPVYMAMFSNPVFSGNTLANIRYTALGIQNETYSQTATIPQRNFAGYTNITYFFNGATINSGTTISIQAGTVFKSNSSSFTINGKLEVDGVFGNPVIFTDYRDDDYGNPADTEQNGSATTPSGAGPAFYFNDVSDDACYIYYALLRYRAYPVNLSSASPIISNNVFYKATTGISNSGVCAPIIANNLFDDLSYAPMSISLVSYPALTAGNSLSGTTFKGIAVNSETLTQDVTLPKRSFAGISNAPYFFSYYTIGTGVTLTIDPGVICKFSYGGWMTVNNGLIAEGLASSGGYIIFTSLTDDFYGGDSNSDGTATSYGSNTWYGITINDVALDPLTRFENCIFRFGKYSTGYGIKTVSASPSILNCSFNNCDNGVYATAASNPTVNYCDFYDITSMAVNNVNQSFVIDAENCWWGDNSGPTHSGNPGGTGEVVSDAVDYDPYGTSNAINPLLGDVSLNSIIQAYDATLILLWIVDPGTYPLTATQLNVADVTGVGGVTALDASNILQFVVGLISYFDAALLSPVPNIVSEVELSIANTAVEPGEEFDLPLSISNVSGVFAMQMTINYNPEYLTALDVENLIPGMNAAYKIDEEAGLINIAFAGIESLESDMTIANLKFIATEEMGLAIETPVEAEYFMANETDLTWNVHNGTVMINGLATGYEEFNEENAKLLSCYPNPFSDHLTIEYTVQQEGNAQIAVYDMYGKMVAEIANGRHAAETYQLNWNGEDLNGIRLNRGTYFVRILTGSKVETEKIQLVR